MKNRKSCEAFTIVELLLSMIAFGLMVLVVGSMLVIGWIGWRDNSESVAMQRDAMVAIRIMAKEIRNSSIDEISGDGNGIYFAANSDHGRDSEIAFTTNQIPANSGVVLQSWDSPVIGTNNVVISFSLANSRGTDQRSYEMTVYPRN